MPPTTIHALHDDLLAHIFSNFQYQEVYSRSPLEEVCQRWRRVYNTSPRIWGVIERFGLHTLHDILMRYPVEPRLTAPRFQAFAMMLLRLRRRAPGMRELELWEAAQDDHPDPLEVCLPTAQAVLAQLSAAPLQRLELELAWASGVIWAQLGQYAAMLTELRLEEGCAGPAAVHGGRGPRAGWDVAAARLESLQQLRHCTLSLLHEEGDSPATLLAALGSLSNLDCLHLTFHVRSGGSGSQQQQVLLSTDLGLLAPCRRLHSVYLAAWPQVAGPEAMQPRVVLEAALSAEAARQLSALTYLMLVSDGVVGQAVHIEQLANLQRLRLVGEPTGRAWHCASLTSLSCWRALLEGPPPVVGDAAVMPRLRHLELQECRMHRGRFPDSIFNLRQLTELVLHCCVDAFAASQGELPLGLTQLTGLRSLKLSQNELQEVPSVVLRLTWLQRLQLDSNPLLELPDGLTALRQLCVLQLCGTSFTGVPSVLYCMPSLIVLDLSCTLVRPSHFNLAKFKKHDFMPVRKNTFVYLGINCDDLEDLDTVEWSTADIYRLDGMHRVRPKCVVSLSVGSTTKAFEIDREFAKCIEQT